MGVCNGLGALQHRGEGIVGWLQRRGIREILSGEEGGYNGIGVWRAKGRRRRRQGEGDGGVSFRGWVVLCSGRGGGGWEERV
jgi:hypothetical protein